jgi:hypothetical protein
MVQLLLKRKILSRAERYTKIAACDGGHKEERERENLFLGRALSIIITISDCDFAPAGEQKLASDFKILRK